TIFQSVARIKHFKADQLPSICTQAIRTHRRPASDEIVGLLLHHRAEAYILWHCRSVRVRTDMEKPLLDAKCHQRFYSERCNAVRRARPQKAVPQCPAVAPGYGHFIGKLTRKADASDAGGNAT